jgi:hypothetical protein
MDALLALVMAWFHRAVRRLFGVDVVCRHNPSHKRQVPPGVAACKKQQDVSTAYRVFRTWM